MCREQVFVLFRIYPAGLIRCIGPIRPVIGPLSPVTLYICICSHNCSRSHIHILSRISIHIRISIPNGSGRGIQGRGGMRRVSQFPISPSGISMMQ